MLKFQNKTLLSYSAFISVLVSVLSFHVLFFYHNIFALSYLENQENYVVLIDTSKIVPQ